MAHGGGPGKSPTPTLAPARPAVSAQGSCAPWHPPVARAHPHGAVGSQPMTLARRVPGAYELSPRAAGVIQRAPGGGLAGPGAQPLSSGWRRAQAWREGGHLSARAVGVEVVQRSLTDGASRALRDIVGHSQHATGTHGASLTALRDGAAQEALQMRASLFEPGIHGISYMVTPRRSLLASRV